MIRNKKLKKLFKHPVQFMKDSLLLRLPDINVSQSYNNIIFVSHLGQLHQAEALIKYCNLNSVLLCILFTDKNLLVPKSIEKSYSRTLFRNHVFLKLPTSPNILNTEKLIYIYKSYKKLLSIVNPISIYVMSFEGHYALLCKLANSSSINASLIEEGTATYKFDINGINLSPIIKNKNIWYFVNFFVLNRKFLNAAYTTHRDFHTIYAAYPDKLAQAFNARHFKKFVLHLIKTDSNIFATKAIKEFTINKDDVFFVSQRYSIEKELYYTTLVDILNRIRLAYCSRLIIKLHPKETLDKIELLNKIINDKNLCDKIVLISDNDFLIEDIIKPIKPKAIIGISSTTLVYSRLISERTETISIAPILIDKLSTIQTPMHLAALQQIREHFNVLKQFDNITYINNFNCIEKLYLKCNEKKKRASCQYFDFSKVNNRRSIDDYKDCHLPIMSNYHDIRNISFDRIKNYLAIKSLKNQSYYSAIHNINSLIDLGLDECIYPEEHVSNITDILLAAKLYKNALYHQAHIVILRLLASSSGGEKFLVYILYTAIIFELCTAENLRYKLLNIFCEESLNVTANNMLYNSSLKLILGNNIDIEVVSARNRVSDKMNVLAAFFNMTPVNVFDDTTYFLKGTTISKKEISHFRNDALSLPEYCSVISLISIFAIYDFYCTNRNFLGEGLLKINEYILGLRDSLESHLVSSSISSDTSEIILLIKKFNTHYSINEWDLAHSLLIKIEKVLGKNIFVKRMILNLAIHRKNNNRALSIINNIYQGNYNDLSSKDVNSMVQIFKQKKQPKEIIDLFKCNKEAFYSNKSNINEYIYACFHQKKYLNIISFYSEISTLHLSDTALSLIAISFYYKGRFLEVISIFSLITNYKGISHEALSCWAYSAVLVNDNSLALKAWTIYTQAYPSKVDNNLLILINSCRT